MMNLRCNQLLQHSHVRGHVLEIGPGTGINFACLYNNPNIQSYTGIESNVHMHPYFYDFVQQWDAPFGIRLSPNSAADMYEIESNSTDTVIMTLVLCSVPDPFPEKILLEVHRILKTGGTFIFLEHILADSQTKPLTNRFQKLIEPLWTILFDGCRFKPIASYFDTMKNVYAKVEYQYTDLAVPVFFLKDAIQGKLVK